MEDSADCIERQSLSLSLLLELRRKVITLRQQRHSVSAVPSFPIDKYAQTFRFEFWKEFLRTAWYP